MHGAAYRRTLRTTRTRRLVLSEVGVAGLRCVVQTGYESGYGYCLSSYGAAYRRTLRTTRTRRLVLGEIGVAGLGRVVLHGRGPGETLAAHQAPVSIN